MNWQPIETAPKLKTVLIYYINSQGHGRIIKAIRYDQYELEAGESFEYPEYCEEKDEYFCPAGWYEQIDNWDDFTEAQVYQGEPTHWMPLPEPPRDT